MSVEPGHQGDNPLTALFGNLSWILPLLGGEQIVGRLVHIPFSSWRLGVVLLILGPVCHLVAGRISRVRDHIIAKRDALRPKGRKGLLNVQIDVPKAMVAQDKRLHRLANLSGELISALGKGNKAAGSIRSADEVDATSKRLAVSSKVAGKIRPIAGRLTKETKAFRRETTTFSTGMLRWLDLAERERVIFGLVDQVPALTKMVTSGTPVLLVLRQTRGVFEKLRGASDSLDIACGQVVNAFDVVLDSTSETVATCESALRRIRALLESTAPPQANLTEGASRVDSMPAPNATADPLRFEWQREAQALHIRVTNLTGETLQHFDLKVVGLHWWANDVHKFIELPEFYRDGRFIDVPLIGSAQLFHGAPEIFQLLHLENGRLVLKGGTEALTVVQRHVPRPGVWRVDIRWSWANPEMPYLPPHWTSTIGDYEYMYFRWLPDVAILEECSDSSICVKHP